MALKSIIIPLFFSLFLLNDVVIHVCFGIGVFEVKHKFQKRAERRDIHLLRGHDVKRHGRLLGAVDLPVGGNGLPSGTGLYFAEIGIGTPSKKYYVQVDTGSDILWVNCVTCYRCPKKSDLGVELTLYDPKGSQSGNLISCDESFCASTYGGEIPGCTPNLPCQYSVLYGDGSSTTGYFVSDFVQYNQVTGNSVTSPVNASVTFGPYVVGNYEKQTSITGYFVSDFVWYNQMTGNSLTSPVNASVTFGCGAQQGGDLGSSSEALDGILGFGQSNSSMLSQLAASGKVKKIFSHCLDTVVGGGIFAIGNVVQPKMKTTPLVPDQKALYYAEIAINATSDNSIQTVRENLLDFSGSLRRILGIGQSNSSMLSELVASGKVKKIFSHCLDTVVRGGIFAIGNVVQTKMKTMPLVPDQPHYNVNLEGIEVGGSLLSLPTDIFATGNKKGTIIDSGTTLTYLPEAAYKAVMNKVLEKHSDITFRTIQDFLCFEYNTGSLDDDFPEIVFNFENNLTLKVYPHDYLFENERDYCVGFQNGGLQSKDGKDMFLLGDLVLSNKLVLYDLENQVIGWTEYNCSSSIKIQDDKTGAIYTVNAHDIGIASRLVLGNSVFLLLLTILFSYLFI